MNHEPLLHGRGIKAEEVPPAGSAAEQPRKIVLIGMAGSGKSVVGRLVAESLGWEYADTDELIVSRDGRRIPQIFLENGEQHFREIERDAIAKLIQNGLLVVATGGGSALSPENRRLLWRDSLVIRLQAHPETLLGRVTAQSVTAESRPLLAGDDPLARIRALATEREPVYSLADWTIHTDALSPKDVAAEIVRVFQLHGQALCANSGRLERVCGAENERPVDDEIAAIVHTSSGEYPILVGWGTLSGLGQRLKQIGLEGRVSVISDRNVAALHGEAALSSLRTAGYEPALYCLEPGEEHKSLDDVAPVFDWLVSRRAERREAIVALGGGVVTDLSGFVAATYLRGVPLVHVPTSLLGAVDAAIGGKVAVDHQQGKNLIGSFYQPRLVLIDGELLTTLPRRELTSGWAEVIKMGLIMDRALVDYLEQHAAAVQSLESEALLPVLRHSAQLKAEIVSADEKETGLRSTLNYGHTIGHALEAATIYRGPLHGEAVAVGMAGVGEIGRRLGTLSEEDLRRQNELIAAYGLPLRWPGADPLAIVAATVLDKKVSAASIRWVLLDGIGRTVFRSGLSSELVQEVVERLVTSDEIGSRS